MKLRLLLNEDGVVAELTILFFIIILLIGAFINQPPPPVTFTKIKIKRVTKPKTQPLDSNKKLAKDTLVSLGFSVKESKEMLKDLHAATPEEYVSQAMRKVKI